MNIYSKNLLNHMSLCLHVHKLLNRYVQVCVIIIFHTYKQAKRNALTPR